MMIIKGLQKLTLIDYPGKVACTLFTFGCNFRCPYCHNPELVIDDGSPPIPEDRILRFLNERKNFLNGVCITGGEPTLHTDLPEFIEKIKKMGYSVKLDTNGTNPDMLELLIDRKLVDYIAMDVKAPLEKYDEVVKVKVNISKITRSIEIVKAFPEHEFRTTVIPELLNREDILTIAGQLKGARRFFIQQFKPSKTLDKAFLEKQAYLVEDLKRIRYEIEKLFEICEIRNV
ncbi:MAG: anaerobic ribonucleoside-triphosphate reductase activating protein [Candidatus Brockarchaeota archaeon]|nr:anaerobic ribonucleoside-triphosphate reductase activating protein [Candidatus Brockarchaeota archaeon]